MWFVVAVAVVEIVVIIIAFYKVMSSHAVYFWPTERAWSSSWDFFAQRHLTLVGAMDFFPAEFISNLIIILLLLEVKSKYLQIKVGYFQIYRISIEFVNFPNNDILNYFILFLNELNSSMEVLRIVFCIYMTCVFLNLSLSKHSYIIELLKTKSYRCKCQRQSVYKLQE